MTESYPSDQLLNALSGTTDAQQEVLFLPIGEAPYYTSFYKMLYRLLDVARRAADLRVYKDAAGALKFGVRPGRWLNGDTAVNYAGASNQTLADNATNYVHLTAAGTLTVNQSGFPVPSATPHLPLATVATGTASATGVAGFYAHEDITDYRGRAFLTVSGASGNAEADAFFADTDISGAEAETLTAGSSSDASSLHVHSRAGLVEDSLARHQVPLMLCRNSNGTVLTAAPDEAYSPNGHFGINTTSGLKLVTNSIQGDDITMAGLFEFPLPVEYIADADVKVVVSARYTGDGTAAVKTVDVEAFELSDAGSLSADLCATNAATLTNAFADHTFTITDTSLTPGDRLLVAVKIHIIETVDENGLVGEIGNIEMQLDVKG